MNLLLLEQGELGAGGEARVSGARAKHVREVLGKTPGDEVRVGVIDGPRGRAEVMHIDDDSITLSCHLEGAIPARPPVDLLLALPRPKVLKRLFAPLAALGIGRLYLTNAERVERYYFDSHAVSEAVYRPLLLEGLAQARDTRLPEVRVLRSLRQAIEEVVPSGDGDARCLLADAAHARSAHDVAARSAGRRLLLALGPEGGWTPPERDLFERHGYVGVGLGPRTLRSDVAAIALLALVHAGLSESSNTH